MKQFLFLPCLLLSIFTYSQFSGYRRDTAATVSTFSTSNEELAIKNLKVLGQLWGFLKYYHPQVAQGKFNWDDELFKMITVIKNVKDDQQLSSELYSWINSLGQIDKCRKCDSDLSGDSFTNNIDLRWMENGFLSEGLRQKLKYILQNRHRGNGYYVRYEPAKNLAFTNEHKYESENIFPDEKFRLHFLFRYWNTIHYFFPYKYVIGKDWNLILEEYIPRFINAKDSLEYHLVINEFVNSVNDSHSGSYDRLLAKELVPAFLPVRIKIIDDQAVVSAYFNDTLARKNSLQIGDVISHLDDKSVKQIIDNRISLVSGSNYPRKLLVLQSLNFITGGKLPSVKLKLTRDNRTYEITSKRYTYEDMHYNYVPDTLKWKILEGNIGYVNMGILEIKDVDAMMKELKDTKAIIFDIRNYPRNTLARISHFLKKSSTEFARIIYPDLEYPGNFKWKKLNNRCGPTPGVRGEFFYRGKTILLVNELTQSHAEWTVMGLQTVKGAVTIGSQTSGADGNASLLYLTGNYFTYMTGLGVFYPDMSSTQRVGVNINVKIKPTVQGIKEGRDEVLEKAIQTINQ